MAATQNIELSKGYNVASAVTKMRFVKAVAGSPETVTAVTAQGERVLGVTMFSVSDSEILRGKGSSVILEGIAILEASGAVPEGSLVTTDVDGRAMVAASGDWIAGTCREAAAADGNQCSVILADNTTTLA